MRKILFLAVHGFPMAFQQFQMMNGLGTRGWEWVKLENFPMKPGEHTIVIAYREDGAKLDKISISNDPCAPEGMGKPALNLKTSR